MLLQTFLQLHILLATTPGLVGWVWFVPATQALPAHVIYLTAQKSTTSESAETSSQASDLDTLGVPARRTVSVYPALRTPTPASAGRLSIPDRLSGSVSLSNHSPRAP